MFHKDFCLDSTAVVTTANPVSNGFAALILHFGVSSSAGQDGRHYGAFSRAPAEGDTLQLPGPFTSHRLFCCKRVRA